MRRGSGEPRRKFLFEENDYDYFFFFLVAFLTAFLTAFFTAFFLAAMCLPPSRLTPPECCKRFLRAWSHIETRSFILHQCAKSFNCGNHLHSTRIQLLR